MPPRLGPEFFPGSAEILWRAVTTKHVRLYNLYRKEILEQIKEFDKELKVTPLGVRGCDAKCVKGDKVMIPTKRGGWPEDYMR